jgi:RNase P/RNase MRP subunit p30
MTCSLSLSACGLDRSVHLSTLSILDSSSRRYLFANVLAFLRLTRGRNLVLSSAASKEMELRAPWDVINLSVE